MKPRADKPYLNFEAAVIGTSAGGMNALQVIFKSLPRDFALSVIIVQHLHPDSDDYSARILNSGCKMTVKQANEKEKIEQVIQKKSDKVLANPIIEKFSWEIIER